MPSSVVPTKAIHVAACAGEVIQLKAAPGATFSIDELKQAVKEHKPAILFLVQVGVKWQEGGLPNTLW